jgi:hypothetical protein
MREKLPYEGINIGGDLYTWAATILKLVPIEISHNRILPFDEWLCRSSLDVDTSCSGRDDCVL